MHHRRIAAFLIGLWMAGSLLMLYVGTQNITTVDGILASIPREGAKLVDLAGAENARTLMRFHAQEQTRGFLGTWELTQFALAILLTATLYLGTHVSRFIVMICGIMLLIVGFAHFVITPELIYTGRNLDFAGPGASRNRVWTLYALYGALDGVKLLLACIVAGYLFRYKTRRVRGESEIPLSMAH